MPRILGIALAAAVALAQEQPTGGGVGTPAPAPAPGPAPSPGGGGGDRGGFPQQGSQQQQPGRQQQDPFGNQQQQQQQRFPDMSQRPIFISGKVVMEDGTPPPESVTIERVCNGVHRPEGYTDSKGRFSFQLGQNQHIMADASTGSDIGGFGGGGFPGQGGNQGMGGFGGGRQGISERDLMGCELRASLPGYRSEVVNLAGRRVMDNPDVGSIIMKRLANVEGNTFSMTSAMAPKDAKKAYEKGLDQIKKKKVGEAQKEFEKAVAAYPKYAIAWFDLGRVHEMNKQPEEARKAYAQALAADARFVKPYLQLAGLAVNDQKWQDVADTTDRIIKLNPVDYPQMFFYNSVAYYNLQKFDKAEDSAREAVKRDDRHRWPKAQHLLGILLAMKEDHKGAVENMQAYLKFAPNAGDADMVKKQIEEISKRLGPGETAQQQQ